MLLIKNKLLGGILMIAGTSIGAGMLTLPIVTAQSGVLGATFLFVVCWAVMTFTAFLTLEVSLHFDEDSNIITMAGETIGKFGKIICWTIYLLFLFSLVSAYISGGSDVFSHIISNRYTNVPDWLNKLIFTLLFGSIVMFGIKYVEVTNKIFMSIKILLLAVIFYCLFNNVEYSNYNISHYSLSNSAISVAITSFGFSIIIPSLRKYFGDNIEDLKKSILIGSLLPLILYIVWNILIFGVIGYYGDYALHSIFMSHKPLKALLFSLSNVVNGKLLNMIFNIFSSICMITAFICVSISLKDYLSDGIRSLKIIGYNKISIILTFIIPLLMTIYFKNEFIFFLSFSGLLCIILQAFMPTIMAFNIRYRVINNDKFKSNYHVFGKRLSLTFFMSVSLFLTLVILFEMIR